MAMSKNIYEEEVDVSHVLKLPPPTNLNHPSDPPKVESLISLDALIGFSTPQTLKLIGYIKHWKVIILIDSGNTHNFIHRRIAQKSIDMSVQLIISKWWFLIGIPWNVEGIVKSMPTNWSVLLEISYVFYWHGWL
jgi:hypothetical protein